MSIFFKVGKIRDINIVDVPDGTLVMNGAHMTLVYRIEEPLRGLQQSSNRSWAKSPKRLASQPIVQSTEKCVRGNEV